MEWGQVWGRVLDTVRGREQVLEWGRVLGTVWGLVLDQVLGQVQVQEWGQE